MTATAEPTTEVTENEAYLKHRRASRWMHWINFPVLMIMIWSGMRIYWANDVYRLGPLQFFPDWWNETLFLDRRLAKGMAFHFTFGWFFTLNGVAYVIFLARSGEWKKLAPTKQDFADMKDVVLHDLGIRKEKPAQGKYNAAQKVTYSGVIVMGAIAVLTGFAIYKPIQLSVLTSLLGGYEGARLIHFTMTIGFMLFFLLHLIQVGRAGWRNFASMITGYELRAKKGDNRG